jgi:DNA-binding IclR family transcriptional regulator
MARAVSNSETIAPVRPRVQSVSRALAILRVVAGSHDGVTARELSDRLELNLSTVHHLVQTLTAEGFLWRDGQRRYRLGLRVGTLVEAFRHQVRPSEHLMPYVRALAARTGEAAYVAGWDREHVVIFAEVPGRYSVTVSDLGVGVAADAHARASGKLLLAYSTPEDRVEYLRLHGMRSRTTSTITEHAAFERECERIRAQGYAVDREEFAIGVCCLGAPLEGGALPFALSLSAPKARFEQRVDAYLAVLLQTVAEASSGTPPAWPGGDVDRTDP